MTGGSGLRTTRRSAGPRRVRALVATMVAELRSAMRTGALLAARRIASPPEHVGRTITFGDGSTSRIYRETRIRGTLTVEPLVLVVRFRLRWLGRSRIGHALFRAESILNTPLFAGFAGFRSKLWLTDRDTGCYRGVYEWDGVAAAVDYAQHLRRVLAPFCRQGTFAYRILPEVRRCDYLAGRLSAGGEDGWWSPARGLRPGHLSGR